MKYLQLFEEFSAAVDLKSVIDEEKGSTVCLVYPPARGVLHQLLKDAGQKKLLGYFDMGLMNVDSLKTIFHLASMEGTLILDMLEKCDDDLLNKLANTLSKSQHKGSVILCSHKAVPALHIFKTVEI